MNFSSILLFSPDPKKLSEFYKKILGTDPQWQEGNYFGFVCGKGFITIGAHEKIKGPTQEPERIMLNFEVEDVQKEFDRIKAVEGVKVIAEPYHPSEEPKMWIATFADPDGNIFQLMPPWEPNQA